MSVVLVACLWDVVRFGQLVGAGRVREIQGYDEDTFYFASVLQMSSMDLVIRPVLTIRTFG